MTELTSVSLWLPVLGAIVGILVGLTGVGGGSLMTPLLTGPMGMPMPLAVGTDLWFAGLTKGFACALGELRARVRWSLVVALLGGSVPASLLTTMWLGSLQSQQAATLMRASLGLALLLTGLSLFYKNVIAKPVLGPAEPSKSSPWMLSLAGAIVGVLTALTSVGAGAIVMALLVRMYPNAEPNSLVATDIAHAVPLALIAGLAYAARASVDWYVLALLLIGSLPGIAIGVWSAKHVSKRLLQSTLAVLLTGFGAKYLGSAL
jgi:uncharacterized protein